MIVINRNKELVPVENWDDILHRPGFNSDLDPTAHELEAIIGRYAFREYIPCGLSNCHTPHGKGYIAATKDGQETNIGKDCGKKYFGVDFEVLSAKFDRDLTEKENRERLWTFVLRIDELRDQIAGIRGGEHGADWIYKRCEPLLRGGREMPAAIARKIGLMLKTGETVVTVDREATEAETQQIEVQTQRTLKRPHYISEPIAEISGMEALHAENDLKELLVLSLEEPLKEFEELRIDELDFKNLAKWAKWTGTVDELLARSAFAVEKGRKLLTSSNLEPFGRVVVLDEQASQTFARYLKLLPA